LRHLTIYPVRLGLQRGAIAVLRALVFSRPIGSEPDWPVKIFDF
jgi:hypothetical protein